MAHAKTQIRNAVVAAIAAADTAADAAVYSGHVYDLDPLPAINVTTPNRERAEDDEGNSFETDAYKLLVEVTLHVRKSDALDDELDDLAAEVEAALTGDSTLAGLVHDLTLLEDDTELEKEGKQPHGRTTMRWACLYLVSREDPETIIT